MSDLSRKGQGRQLQYRFDMAPSCQLGRGDLSRGCARRCVKVLKSVKHSRRGTRCADRATSNLRGLVTDVFVCTDSSWFNPLPLAEEEAICPFQSLKQTHPLRRAR